MLNYVHSYLIFQTDYDLGEYVKQNSSKIEIFALV